MKEERKIIAGVFPVEISYRPEDTYVRVHSLSSHVSGGDYGSGLRYSYDWELKIPVYEKRLSGGRSKGRSEILGFK